LSNWPEISIVSRQIDERTSNRRPQQPLLAARSPHEFTLAFNNASVDALMSLLLLVCLLFYSGHLEFSINSLTAKSVPAGTKNSRPVGFYSRNSTKSTVNPNTTIPQILPPWWCRSPLIRRGIYGSFRSDARNLFRRCRAGRWSK
jgi:hypothetical protein